MSAVPPPESVDRCLATKFLERVAVNATWIADGNRSYKRLAKLGQASNLYQVAHAKNNFVREQRVHSGRLLVHSGHIDNLWKQLKDLASIICHGGPRKTCDFATAAATEGLKTHVFRHFSDGRICHVSGARGQQHSHTAS